MTTARRNSKKEGLGMNSARLKEAREARGMSMSDLAEAIGVSRQSVSQYERGETTPGALTLAKIIDILELPLSFFTSTVDEVEPPAGTIFFRSLQSATSTSRDRLSVRARWVGRIYNYLSEFINFPQTNIPTIENHFDLDNLTSDDIEEIAMYVRKSWGLGLGPISDVTLLMEKNGCIVSRFRFDEEKMDGFSQWRGDRPFIFLATDKESAVRTRFDDVHELGHLILHSHIGESELRDPKVMKRIETEAHAFASAFLLPSDSFSNEILSSSLDHFITLKRRWKVSVSAMVVRCDRLGLLSENQIIYLHRQIAQRKMRQREPLDDVLPIETPRLLNQAVTALLKNNIQTVANVLDRINLPSSDIEELCNLPSGTLSMDGKVIPLQFRSNDDSRTF